jgi:hypothetical protein
LTDSPRAQWGVARVAVAAKWDAIKADLDARRPLIDIYRRHFSADGITYSAVRRQVVIFLRVNSEPAQVEPSGTATSAATLQSQNCPCGPRTTSATISSANCRVFGCDHAARPWFESPSRIQTHCSCCFGPGGRCCQTRHRCGGSRLWLLAAAPAAVRCDKIGCTPVS